MAASSNDLLMEVGIATATTLDANYTINDASITVVSTTNWPTATGIIFAIDVVDSSGEQVPGTYNEYEGVVASATSITGVDHHNGTDRNYSAGATTRVYIPVSAERENRIVEWGLAEHNQDGSHADVDATTLDVSGATTLTGALTLKSYDGWINTADTWTYATATTFTIAGVDRTAQFPKGTKIKLTQTTAKYFYVTSSSFSTDTTVTVTGGSDYSLANAAITSPALSYDATPQAFPSWFNWAPTITNVTLGNGTLTAKYSMSGKTVHFKLRIVFGSTTAISDVPVIPLPVTAINDTTLFPLGQAFLNDATGGNEVGFVQLSSTTTATVYRTSVAAAPGGVQRNLNISSSAPWTWTTSDSIATQGFYEAA